MRRTMIVGAVVAAVLTGSPALAAPPEVNAKACEESGGTFSRERGVKTCTIPQHQEVTFTTERRYVNSTGFGTYTWIATMEIRQVWDGEQTSSQQGNGPVSYGGGMTLTEETVTPTDCQVRSEVFGSVTVTQRPYSDCARYGLYDL